jgi:hypothetical protein
LKIICAKSPSRFAGRAFFVAFGFVPLASLSASGDLALKSKLHTTPDFSNQLVPDFFRKRLQPPSGGIFI